MRRLHHFTLSPFCRKVRLALAEKALEVDLFEEKPWERRREFLELSPAAEVPVFVDEGGVSIADSTAILEYLEECYPATRLLPDDFLDRAEARRLMAWFDTRFHHEVTMNLLYERVQKRLKGEGYPDSAYIRAGSANIKHHLDYIHWLAERRNWLAGETLSFADLAAAAHLSCLDYIGAVPWDHSDLVRQWYSRIKSRQAFRSLLVDHVPGMPPPRHYNDLDF